MGGASGRQGVLVVSHEFVGLEGNLRDGIYPVCVVLALFFAVFFTQWAVFVRSLVLLFFRVVVLVLYCFLFVVFLHGQA